MRGALGNRRPYRDLTFQDKAELGKALSDIKKAGLLPEEQIRLCVVCDGASWIGKHVQSLYPEARQVLDYSAPARKKL